MNSKLVEHLARYAPWYGVAVTLLYFGYFLLPVRSPADDFNYHAFGRLPVYDGGRYKPMDTFARTKLMILTHRQDFYDPEAKKYYPATKWLLDVYTSPIPGDHIMATLLSDNNRTAWDQKVFRVENDQVVEFLGLKMVDGLRYSLAELVPGIGRLMVEATRITGDEDLGIKGIEPKHWTVKDGKIVELAQHVRLYQRVAALDAPLLIPNPEEGGQWSSFRDYLGEAMKNRQIGSGADGETFKVYQALLTAYQNNDKKTFNSVLARHLSELDKNSAAGMGRLDTEIRFNEFAPFYRSLIAYIVIAIMAAASWLAPNWSQPLRKTAYASMGVVFLFHLSGLIFRMYLQDRMFVFVTNLYSSAVFIGLGCVASCLIAEWFYRNGIAIVVGSVTGFCTLIIAHMLSLSGDTMEMMQAVLDTNFWLATHVTCVTLGYTMAFVAGFMGIAYIFLGFFTDMLRKEGSANLTRMTYGILCAGMFLSFVGTVLGGLWADYSWGRFWGWDPKENGALLIVIWIALILHARWGGLVKHRGIAVLSVLGIIITSWSWFGTNFLGVGLHSYGFRQGAMATLILVDFGFLAIAGLGMLPLNMWQSFRPPSSVAAQPPGGKPSPPDATGIKKMKPKLA
jgi:ABC-type transport system involved in cytochrome c biogenesis permease subunit